MSTNPARDAIGEIAIGEIAIELDGKPARVAGGMTLAALVEQQGLAPTEIATAVNGSFCARDARGTVVLAAGDRIVFFRRIVGG